MGDIETEELYSSDDLSFGEEAVKLKQTHIGNDDNEEDGDVEAAAKGAGERAGEREIAGEEGEEAAQVVGHTEVDEEKEEIENLEQAAGHQATIGAHLEQQAALIDVAKDEPQLWR